MSPLQWASVVIVLLVACGAMLPLWAVRRFSALVESGKVIEVDLVQAPSPARHTEHREHRGSSSRIEAPGRVAAGLSFDDSAMQALYRASGRQVECRTVNGVLGAEDMSVVFDDVVLGVADHRLRLWETHGPDNVPYADNQHASDAHSRRQSEYWSMEEARGSALFALEVGSGTLWPLPIAAFPSARALRPHGLALFRVPGDESHDSSQLLYVVNHAYAQGGERIEVLLVQRNRAFRANASAPDTEPAAASEPPVHLRYLRSIFDSTHQREAMGVLNDVAPVRGGVFVTQYMPVCDASDGRVPPSFAQGLAQLSNLAAWMLDLGWSRIWYCPDRENESSLAAQLHSSNTTNDNDEPSAQCRVVAVGGAMFNGISIDEHRQLAVVADAIKRTIEVWSLPELDRPERLVHLASIPLPFAVDNVERDATDGRFYLGSIGRLKGFFDYIDRAKAVNGLPPRSTLSPGGAQRLTISGDSLAAARRAASRLADSPATPIAGTIDPDPLSLGLEFKLETLMMHDGRQLPGISVATRVGHHLVLGSWCDRGILICKPESL